MVSGAEAIVIIPARDEAVSIGTIVSRLVAAKHDVLVVVNPSKDGTADIARKSGAIVIENETDFGIGGSLCVGYRYALDSSYPIIAQMDAGFSHSTDDLESMIHIFMSNNNLDALIGSRLMHGSSFVQKRLRKFLTKASSVLGNIASNKSAREPNDYTSGLRVFSRSAINTIVSAIDPSCHNGHSFNFVVAVRMCQQNFSVSWVPMNYVSGRSSATLSSILIAAREAAIVMFY